MTQQTASPAASAAEVVAFWRQAGRQNWFRKSDTFDREVRERLLPLHEAAKRGELQGWHSTAEGTLALLILLDQFPRNAFRASPRMYETDAQARQIAAAAIDAGFDMQTEVDLRAFFYLPFSHSEALADQQRAVALQQPMGQDWLYHAKDHLAIVARFGRFPHRNAILGRETTPEEQAFLDEGGFAG